MMARRRSAVVRVLGRLLTVISISAAALAGFAGPAAASVTQQGTAEHPFTWSSLPSTLEVVDGTAGGQDLRLALTADGRIAQGSVLYGDGSADARSVEALDDGHLLITDRSLRIVAEVTRAGDPVWAYSVDEDPALQRPFSAQRFARSGREYTLIADRWACRVWAVDESGSTVWQYGVTNEKGTGINHLADPFHARYSDVDGGTVVITDNNDGNRVIEVRYGDYRAGAPDNGFTAESIIWSYGTPGDQGSGPGQLDKPHSAERVLGGNILVADEDAARVIEIDRETREVVWQYGVTDQPGDGEGQLKEPNFARRLSDGDTLIADAGNARVLRVSRDGALDREYDMNALGRPPWVTSTSTASPRQAAYTHDGLLAVADSGFQQVVLLGYADRAQAVSTPLACGLPRVRKAFVSLSWQADTDQSGTRVGVEYRLDGGRWRACTPGTDGSTYAFPAGTVGETIAYRVTLSSTDRGHTPTLDSIGIRSTRAKAGGGGGGGGSAGGSGNSGQTASYTYPQTAQGGTGTSGIGTGAGGYGSGWGSGTADAGSGSSAAGSGSSAVAESVDVPVESAGSGPAQPVEGFEVQGQEGVSGVPLRAKEGEQVADSGRSGAPFPVLALLVAGLVLAAAFFLPWPFVAARLRRLTGFDHTRPQRFLPFRPLGR